jgi:Protein of unknown function (DUF2853)
MMIRESLSCGHRSMLCSTLKKETISMAKETDFLAQVQRYDADADPAKVSKIVSHLGIAMQTNPAGSLTDSGLVSATDQTELNRVRDKWCVGKLGLDEGSAALIVNQVADEMKSDTRKNRVTFYYLAAKHAEKLDVI